MGKLKQRHTFKRWAPDIGENRDLDEPAIWFELATGLTHEQLRTIREVMAAPLVPIEALPEGATGAEIEAHDKAHFEGIKSQLRAKTVDAIGKYVRIVGGPHSIDGQPLETLEDYLVIVQQQRDLGQLAMMDLQAALFSFNTFGGGDELFSPRRSGSPASTGPQSVAKTEPQTDGA